MKSYSDISNRYMKNNKKRSTMTILGIVMATVLIFAIITFLLSARDTLILKQRTGGSDYEFKLDSLSFEQTEKLINNAEVKNASIILSCEDTYTFNKKEISVVKGDSEYFKRMYGKKISKGRLPKDSSEAVIDNYTKDFLDKDVGDEIELACSNGSKEKYKIVGISNSKYYMGNALESYIDSSKLDSSLKYNVAVNLKSDKNKQNIIKKVLKTAGITTNSENFHSNSMLLYLTGNGGDKDKNTSIEYLAIFVMAIIVISTIIVIYNSFNMSVIERIRYFGILKAIGATPNQIRNIIFKEGLIMGLIAFPIGCIVGFFGLKFGVQIFLGDDVFELGKFKIGFYPIAILLSAIVVAFTIFISILFPAIKARRISAVEAMKNTNEIKKGKIKRRRKGIIGRIFGVEGNIAYKSIRRTPLRFVITVLALTVSIVIFNVFYGFMDFAEQTVKNEFGNQPYDANINVFDGFNENDLDKLKEQDFLKNMSVIKSDSGMIPLSEKEVNNNVKNEFHIKNIEKTNYKSIGASIYSTDNKSLSILKQYIVDGKFDENKLNEGQVILVQGIQKKNSRGKYETVMPTTYKPGDKIRIPRCNFDRNESESDSSKEGDEKLRESIDKNNFVEVTIAAIADKDPFTGFSTKNGLELYFNDKSYEKIDNKANITQIGIKFDNDSDRKKALNYFNNDANKGSYEYNDLQSQVEEINKLYSQMSFFVYCFIIIISIISIVNIVNTISTNLILRKKEFSTLKAIGMTDKQLRKSVTLEGTIYGIISSVIGGICSAVLLYVLVRLGTGISEVKYHFAVLPFVLSIVVTILITYIATLAPLRTLKKITIVEGIRDDE